MGEFCGDWNSKFFFRRSLSKDEAHLLTFIGNSVSAAKDANETEIFVAAVEPVNFGRTAGAIDQKEAIESLLLFF
ncbi:hypothetical protein CEXT_327021 [Caerostris extrusa]|uniref:Uncharacterized protein n=1 Tax=Caerostris extrusa TaxID=172846 RepID=A0AAV4SV02_CAEEX|nr:hypothetical protein CEXT_327021 [Caerostris extrusa]